MSVDYSGTPHASPYGLKDIFIFKLKVKAHTFCINLKRREDRRIQAEAELKKHCIAWEFVDGVDGQQLPDFKAWSIDQSPVSRGDLGCTLSHLKVAKIAKERGLKEYVVFEDDVQFIENFDEQYRKCVDQLPADWQFFYLGGNHMGGITMVTENLGRIKRTFTTHAYAVRGEDAINAIIEVLSKQEKVDVAIATLHERFNSYACKPPIAWQRPSFSDILERHADYKHLQE